MTIERNGWLYVFANSAEHARRIVGVSEEMECHKNYDRGRPIWGVRVPRPRKEEEHDT